ncbi:MAPEG family protein [Pseudoxanthomonas koreensis]|uniref:MAPEG family protein n=1 Tax=Pseudoxanthomonas koreensis TaxID=266061 RepID=UPI0013915D16|nr:MAPEG family protein [Pseudoxanthomonas koreensis]
MTIRSPLSGRGRGRGRGGEASALGVQLYLWARLVYVPLYLSGVPYVRSLVWAVAMAGLALVLWPLLH